jgi:glycerol kinase
MGKILAIDEGTTSSRAAVYDLTENKIIFIAKKELKQYYPNDGYVEENAEEIYNATYWSLCKAIESIEDKNEIKGLGITNQRETVIMWDKQTGEPIYNAIVWQCRRTAKYCETINKKYGEIIKNKTGLIVDAYFSASKIKWLLDNVKQAKELLKQDRLLVGTIDTFIIYRLTRGKSFVTDVTNASRTMLFNIHTLQWDKELLEIFDIPEKILARVTDSDEIVGELEFEDLKIPICGIAGDQQAALVGQCCFDKGESKTTYGTGMFMLFNTGNKPPVSDYGMLTTIGYKIDGKLNYALEGSVFNAGSAIQWLRDNLNFFDNSADSYAYAVKHKTTDGVYIIPAFTGLGAPHWNSDAKGIICGITRNTDKYHITRAVLEAMAYSARELIGYMEKDSGVNLKILKCDGGGSGNDFLMQFQADILGIITDRPTESESTILGAAYLCILGLKIKDLKQIKNLRKTEKLFLPEMDRIKADKLYNGYLKAVKMCLMQGEL